MGAVSSSIQQGCRQQQGAARVPSAKSSKGAFSRVQQGCCQQQDTTRVLSAGYGQAAVSSSIQQGCCQLWWHACGHRQGALTQSRSPDIVEEP